MAKRTNSGMGQEKNPQKKTKSDEKDVVDLRVHVNRHAQKVVEERFRDSSHPDHSSRYPKFSLQDVVHGKYLGRGKFGMVFEVLALDGRGRSSSSSSSMKMDMSNKNNYKWFKQPATGIRPTIKANPNFESDDDDDVYDLESEEANNDDDDEQQKDDEDGGTTGGGQRRRRRGSIDQRRSEARLKQKRIDAQLFMQQHCLREADGKPRYAIKMLRTDTLKEATTVYFQGIMDMACETRLLSSIRHPHIVKLRGVGNDPCSENYFLILDRLYQTLEQRRNQWKKRQRWYSSFGGMFDWRVRRRTSMYQERIIYAHDLASGLAHLHANRILHRDIKSDNIGFDVRGDIKIFDFGLARELPPQEKATADGTWNMTGNTGTPRYMSPEVALEEPYNESCDTYSFCILLWEILALTPAFELYTWTSFRERVWRGPHKRPPLPTGVWSDEIQQMLRSGWSGKVKERQPMTDIVETLRQEVIRYDGFDDEWGLIMERQSTHVFDDHDIHHLNVNHDRIRAMLLASSSKILSDRCRGGGGGGWCGSSVDDANDGGGCGGSVSRKSPSNVVMDTTTETHIMEENSSRRSGYGSSSSPHSLPGNVEPPPLFILGGDEDEDHDDDGKNSRKEEESFSAHADMYHQMKSEAIRLKRERVFGSNRSKGLMDDVDGDEVDDRDESKDSRKMMMKKKREEDVSSSSRTRTNDIWDRIREETTRQNQIRSRLSITRDRARSSSTMDGGESRQ